MYPRVFRGLLIGRGAEATGARVRGNLPLPGLPRADAQGNSSYSAWISIPALLTAFIIVGACSSLGSRRRNPRVVAVLVHNSALVFRYREMNLKHLYDSFVERGGSPPWVFCVGTASAFGWLLRPTTRSPRALARQRFHVGMGHRERVSSSLGVPGGRLLPRRDPAIIIFGRSCSRLAQSGPAESIHFAIIGSVCSPFGLVTPALWAVLMNIVRGRPRCRSGSRSRTR